MNSTLKYYNQNANQFVQGTFAVDFKQTQDRFLINLPAALKDNGVVYTSFKHGSFEGERNGRYFTDFTIGDFEKYLHGIPELQIEDYWITGDVRPGRDEEKWLNLILRKKGIH